MSGQPNPATVRMAESPTRLEKGREVLRAMDDRFALRALSAVLIPLLDRWTSPDPDIDAQPGFGLPRRRGPAVYRGRPPFGVSDMSAQERSISKTSIRLRQRTTRVTSARAGGAWGWWGIGQAGTKPPRTMTMTSPVSTSRTSILSTATSVASRQRCPSTTGAFCLNAINVRGHAGSSSPTGIL